MKTKTPTTTTTTTAATVNPDAVTTVTRLIGSNRGKARLWLEGVCLSSQGWVKGTVYAPVWNRNARTLEYVRAVSAINVRLRKVAGTKDRPIIDTNTDELKTTMIVNVGDKVLVTITAERIVVRAYNPATDDKPQTMAAHHQTTGSPDALAVTGTDRRHLVAPAPKPLKPGDAVMIYQDPLTRKQEEGPARLVIFVSRDEAARLETWRVHFEGDDPGVNYFRTIFVG